MSEAHTLLHSGCLWVCFKSPFSRIQCWPAVFFILWFLLQDLDKRHHMWTAWAPQPDTGKTMDCSPSVVWMISHETRGEEHFNTGTGSDHRAMAPYQLFHPNTCFPDQPIHIGQHLCRSVFSRDIFSWTGTDINQSINKCKWGCATQYFYTPSAVCMFLCDLVTWRSAQILGESSKCHFFHLLSIIQERVVS